MTMFAVFDVETTGLHSDRGDRIVEIAVLVLDDQFRVVRLLDSMVNPGRRIPANATAVHKLTDADVASAPTFSELLPDLHACFQGVTHFVGHNLKFDLAFLKAAFNKSGDQVPDGLHNVCTLQLAKRYAVGSEDNRYKLPMVAAALNIPHIAGGHQAIVDTGVTAKIFSMLYGKASNVNQSLAYWPLCEANRPSSRQLPREKPSISCQRLASLGLCLSSMLVGNPPDSSQIFGNAASDEEFVGEQNIGLSSAAVAELKARVKFSVSPDLEIQRPHVEMNDTSSLTWYLFTQQKKDVASIAKERSLSESTIYTHLEQAVRYRLIDISCVATPTQIQQIAEARARLPVNDGKLKPLAEALNGEFCYGFLKCVVTWLDRVEKSL
jgi:DNA polymerase-3 subunit epsilon